MASILATDVNESIEFFKNIPIKNYLLGLSIVPSILLYYNIIKKFNVKFYRNKTLLIIFIITAMLQQSPFQFFRDSSDAIKLVNQEIKKLNDLKHKNTWGKSTLNNSKYDTYILIIGESVRRDYLNAYNYPIPNTPFMSKSNGVIVDGLTATGNNTISSLRLMLTQPKNNISPQYDKNFIDLVNSSGIETYWISNQGYLGKYDTPITAIAQKSKYKYFIKNLEYNSMNTSDYSLIPEFRKTLQNKNKKLVVLHLYGSHPNSCDRIIDYPKILENIDPKYDEINCYISSIKKTDSILEDIYKILLNEQKVNKLTFSMLYFSDHGLSSSLNNENINLRVGDHRQSYEVPLFTVSSDSLTQKRCTSFKSGLNFTNGLADWIGILNKQVPSYSLIDCKDDDDVYNQKKLLDIKENEPAINLSSL